MTDRGEASEGIRPPFPGLGLSESQLGAFLSGAESQGTFLPPVPGAFPAERGPYKHSC